MIRKFITALILIPLAIVFVAFAVANRQVVTVSLDPLGAAHPAFTVSMPLFALILALAIGGVMVGGAAAWLRQAKWRRAARYHAWQARELRAELDALRRRGGAADPAVRSQPDYEARLSIPPPAA
jgi:uncharacterized integral membrane protein